MPVPKQYADDVKKLLAKRKQQGADFWTTPDGRWGKGSPFSTFDCILSLTELGMARTDPVLKGCANVILGSWKEDGRFQPAPKSRIYPCHTANAARALCRLGLARDRRLRTTFAHLFEEQHEDGGWRCNTVKLGASADTDLSNPGVTLAVLDAFRFSTHANKDKRLDKAVKTVLSHWDVRRPLGPCNFGIGSRFMQVEYPFLRYNLFYWVYVVSHYRSAHKDARFKKALRELESRMVDGEVVVENPNRSLAKFEFCKKGHPSKAATKRYREILENIG